MSSTIKRHGPVITPNSIPKNIDSSNINGPCVFERPNFLPGRSRYIMLFAHHRGDSIRVAYSNEPHYGWRVSQNTILKVDTLPELKDHVASPDVIVGTNDISVLIHGVTKGRQETRCYITKDLRKFEHHYEFPQVQFYARYISRSIGSPCLLYKNENIGGMLCDFFGKSKKHVLPNMRHACYDSKTDTVYYTRIGDCPEHIRSIKFNNIDSPEKSSIFMKPEGFEVALRCEPSRPGARIGNTEIRDPFILNTDNKKFIYYSYRGEEGIACAEII